jgi:uncharacterized membrane protein YraQ (UPF0718 family)
MIKELLKKYNIFIAVQVIDTLLFFFHPVLANLAWGKSISFSVNIAIVLPPILLLLGFLDTWLPSQAVEAHLGKKSGVKGIFLATFMGSFAAGPLFAAFPVAASFASKGGRMANTVIFLGAWATIKVPMLLMESQFLGIRFSLLRLAITLPLIVLIGLAMEKLMPKEVAIPG